MPTFGAIKERPCSVSLDVREVSSRPIFSDFDLQFAAFTAAEIEELNSGKASPILRFCEISSDASESRISIGIKAPGEQLVITLLTLGR